MGWIVAFALAFVFVGLVVVKSYRDYRIEERKKAIERAYDKDWGGVAIDMDEGNCAYGALPILCPDVDTPINDRISVTRELVAVLEPSITFTKRSYEAVKFYLTYIGGVNVTDRFTRHYIEVRCDGIKQVLIESQLLDPDGKIPTVDVLANPYHPEIRCSIRYPLADLKRNIAVRDGIDKKTVKLASQTKGSKSKYAHYQVTFVICCPKA